MKEFKGEPGPWILGGCSGRMITTKDGYVGNGFIADVDTLANARLIAAAPELLEALQETIHEVGHWLSTQKPELKEKIESAIKKALGE